MKLKDKLITGAVNVVSKITGSLAQDESARQGAEQGVDAAMSSLLRTVAAEGAVLLENRVLPLKTGTMVSVFGRVQLDWFFTGYGSGGDVNAPYKVNLLEGLRNCPELIVNEELRGVYEAWVQKNPADHGFWGHWPRFHPEMPLSEELVKTASQKGGNAVVVIGRSSGEDRENVLEKGSYYLTDDETRLLDTVTAYFSDTIVLLNIGSIMDLSWIGRYKERLGTVLLLWQGGMESGNAACDLLCGKASPNGRLTDTVANAYEDYPSSPCFGGKKYNFYLENIYVGYRWFETFRKEGVLYPFGYGLSYTAFSRRVVKITPLRSGYEIEIVVTNTGRLSGRETVCLYIEKPCATLGNPLRELAVFKKTRSLSPGESQYLSFSVDKAAFASYDDAGKTGNKSCYVIEKGVYRLYLGGDVRNASKIFELSFPENEIIERLSEAAAPKQAFSVVSPGKNDDGSFYVNKQPVSLSTVNLKRRILDNLPESIPPTGDRGYTLSDVRAEKVSLDDFIAQLTDNELEALSRGDYTMNSPLGQKGNAGVLGGVLESLRKKGLPPVTVTDGPSGIRLFACCSLMPIGTLLACTFDTALIEALFEKVGQEMKDRGSDILLAPGMNIHRNPLCGRNFEYYSEDPLVTGKIAAAAVRGLQKAGVSACPKHFACNNQEVNRNRNDSRLSERALRQIYLKGFEICVKEASPQWIMTSYNKINGVWGHYHYDLCVTILRKEWGFQGAVMTDWWMKKSASPEFPALRDNAYRVRAGVDVLMPGGKRVGKKKPDGTLIKTLGKPDGITRGELQHTAQNVLYSLKIDSTH